jgi:glycosidase
MIEATHHYPTSVLDSRWWEHATAIARPYLKSRGKTLLELAASIDDYQSRGIDTIEIFAPCLGGTCYNGLDTIDYYQVDPAIGTIEDMQFLIREAHARRMAIVLFINLGYGHEKFPAFLKACDDTRSGNNSPETKFFLWSETGQDKMDRNHAPYFMNDLHGNWRWSVRAGKYFWVKWEGEKGGYHLPQFNFGDTGWQIEVQRILGYWLAIGIDGMVIDAVNWYVNCTWEICRSSMTEILRQANNQFCQPEGAGGFHDDPVSWVEQGCWNCIMDYSIKLWWEGIDVIRHALLTGDPRPVETALRQYRDRVVAAGGACYIDPPALSDFPLAAQIMGAALTASMGELVLLLGNHSFTDDTSEEEDLTYRTEKEYRIALDRLIQLRHRFPALCAGGERRQVSTSDDTRFYAFIRGSDDERILAVFNFQPTPQIISLNLFDFSNPILEELNSGKRLKTDGEFFSLNLPAYGYRFFKIEVN